MKKNEGILFSDEYQKSLKEQFCYAGEDPEYGSRLFFENSGGSLRLKKAAQIKYELEQFPDCPERVRGRGYELSAYVKDGTKEILEIVFGAKSGALITELSASQTMFQAVGTILENVKWGTNAVTSSLEHPSALSCRPLMPLFHITWECTLLRLESFSFHLLRYLGGIIMERGARYI